MCRWTDDSSSEELLRKVSEQEIKSKLGNQCMKKLRKSPETFDVTLLSHLLIENTGLGSKGLLNYKQGSKMEIGHFVQDIRSKRNKILHEGGGSLDESDFETLWKDIQSLLSRIAAAVDVKAQEALAKKTDALLNQFFQSQEKWTDYTNQNLQLQEKLREAIEECEMHEQRLKDHKTPLSLLAAVGIESLTDSLVPKLIRQAEIHRLSKIEERSNSISSAAAPAVSIVCQMSVGYPVANL